MADYAATANSIFDPQLQAEETALGSQRDTSLQSLKDETATVNPYYDSAEKTLNKTRASEGQTADFNYNEAGIFDSGLRQNAQNALGQDLIDQTKSLETERATKLTSIADQTKLTKDQYTSGVSGLVSKYQGLKNQYITEQQKQDAQIAEQVREFNANLNLQEQQMNNSLAAARIYAGSGSGASSGGGGDSPSRQAYNNSVQKIDQALHSYQAAGYKGNIGSRATTYNALAKSFAGQGISAQEIQAEVNRLYDTYHVR